MNTDTCGAGTGSANIYSYRFNGDSLATSFVITIKKDVKAHKHVMHSEHVLVLEGEAEMTLGEERRRIKKGDLIFIPRGTVHSVVNTGDVPLRVLSVQAPAFDGSDRVMIK